MPCFPIDTRTNSGGLCWGNKPSAEDKHIEHPAHSDSSGLSGAIQSAMKDTDRITVLPNELLLEITKYVAFPDTINLRSTSRIFHALIPNSPIFNLPLAVRFNIQKTIDKPDYKSLVASCHYIRDTATPTRSNLAALELALHQAKGHSKNLACYTCLRFLRKTSFPKCWALVRNRIVPIRQDDQHRESSINRRKSRSWTCIGCFYHLSACKAVICRHCRKCIDDGFNERARNRLRQHLEHEARNLVDGKQFYRDGDSLLRDTRQVLAIRSIEDGVCEECKHREREGADQKDQYSVGRLVFGSG